VLSRWTLERTIALLERSAEAAASAGPGGDLGEPGPWSPSQAPAAILRAVLATQPLPRPADHVGPAATDMFVTCLDVAFVHGILGIVDRATVSGRLVEVLEGRSPVGFVAAWREYAGFVERARRVDPAESGAEFVKAVLNRWTGSEGGTG
jgi:hypothetical protein